MALLFHVPGTHPVTDTSASSTALIAFAAETMPYPYM